MHLGPSKEQKHIMMSRKQKQWKFGPKNLKSFNNQFKDSKKCKKKYKKNEESFPNL